MSTVGDMASSSVDADMDERDDSDALSITSDLDAPTPAGGGTDYSLKTALALRDRLLQGGTEVNAVGGGQDLLADPRFPVFLKGEGLAVDPAFSGFFKHMGCGKETPAGPN
ncbi:hypothetical protein OC834_000931 [Tilletia horrida]|nr:hypothetical protein OC834_000931 [Tilletia horrida]